MIDGLEPYPVYADSGVEWLGKVPSTWTVKRSKHVLRESQARSTDGSEQLLRVSQYTGVTPRQRSEEELQDSLVGYRKVRGGELVVNIMLAWNGSLGVSREDGIVSPAYAVFGFRGQVPRYFHYLLRTPGARHRMKASSRGVVDSRLRLYPEDLLRIEVPVPPDDDQTAIVRYLDYMDSRIQRVIAAKERLIELLEEEQQAIVRSAVTRGLDSDVQLKPSGVGWLGDVPHHWDIRRLKTFARMRAGNAITVDSIEATGAYPVYGGNGLRGYTDRPSHRGARLLVGRQGALCGNVHAVDGEYWASEHAIVVERTTDCDIGWLSALLTAMDLNQYSQAAAQPGLSTDRIRNLKVPFPPVAEQRAIKEEVQGRSDAIKAASLIAQRQIRLLREFRTGLVADVVTGQLDVRQAAHDLAADPQDASSRDEQAMEVVS